MPGGATEVVASGVLDGASRGFALHCDPRLEVGRLGTRVGPITSACDVVEIALRSPGGHTARPHLTADLVEALGLLITQLPLLLTRHVDPRSGTVLVWGAVHAGEAANAIPQEAIDSLFDRYQNVYGQAADARFDPADTRTRLAEIS